MILTGRNTDRNICLSINTVTTNPTYNFIGMNRGFLIGQLACACACVCVCVCVCVRERERERERERPSQLRHGPMKSSC